MIRSHTMSSMPMTMKNGIQHRYQGSAAYPRADMTCRNRLPMNEIHNSALPTLFIWHTIL